jgi:quercetin 2,3-dioxygenase
MNDGIQVIVPREVPLGGPRAMTVRRTLPARERSFVGAWCFVDHYGPDDVSTTGGMDVAPHPHCALATVSWLFSGEVEHRDSLGTLALVRPGEVNLMTAGRGISHSEVSTPGTTVLHGAQLWLVLPAASAQVEPRFEHHAPEVVQVADGVRAQVFVGSLWGSVSPVRVESPLVGAEVVLGPGAVVDVPVPDGFELAVLVDSGEVTVAGSELARGELGVVEAARHPSSVLVAAGPAGARVLVLGGEPFAEEVVMWWNFIGRSHEDVAAAREGWEAGGEGRFGRVEGYAGEVARIPAPALPGVRLRPRANRVRPVRPGGRGEAGDGGFTGAEAPAMS